jgi:hypothetical protein
MLSSAHSLETGVERPSFLLEVSPVSFVFMTGGRVTGADFPTGVIPLTFREGAVGDFLGSAKRDFLDIFVGELGADVEPLGYVGGELPVELSCLNADRDREEEDQGRVDCLRSFGLINTFSLRSATFSSAPVLICL